MFTKRSLSKCITVSFGDRSQNVGKVVLQQQVAIEIPRSTTFTVLLVLHCAYYN